MCYVDLVRQAHGFFPDLRCLRTVLFLPAPTGSVAPQDPAMGGIRLDRKLSGLLHFSLFHIPATSGPPKMRQTRAGRHRPVHSLQAVTSPISEMLPRDFDAIPEAEDELRREVMAGHLFGGEPFTGKPRS